MFFVGAVRKLYLRYNFVIVETLFNVKDYLTSEIYIILFDEKKIFVFIIVRLGSPVVILFLSSLNALAPFFDKTDQNVKFHSG